MINRVILMGRITQDLVLRQTPSGVPTLSFTVAVDRNYTSQNGERQTDFIRCVAWRQHAEFISRYFGKGRMIAIEGSIRTGSYDKDGVRHYTTDVYVDQVSFTGEPRQNQGGYQNNYGAPAANNAPYQNNYANTNSNANSSNPAPAQNGLNTGAVEDFAVLDENGIPF